MAVTFVIDRAGSGKTQRQFRAIVAAMKEDPLGPPIYWLLPRQATFNAERELTCLSGLDAFCRTRIVWFDQFGRDVFEECGGTSIPQVTALGRQLIIGHLLRKVRDRLRFYSRVARQPGLAAQLDAIFTELERCGKTGADLATCLAELADSNAADLELAPLLDKLHDVRLLYEAYTAYLGQDRLDQHRRLVEVEKLLSHCSFLKRATIYLDGFLDLTESERRILVGAAKAGANIEIALLMDPNSPVLADPKALPDEMSLFRKTEDTYRRLFAAFEEAGVAIGETVRLVHLNSPSPGTPGEGEGGGLDQRLSQHPLPNPPPEYRGREKARARRPEPDQPGLFDTIVPADALPPERFFAGAQDDGSKAAQSDKSQSLKQLERDLFREPIVPSSCADGIELIEAPDRATEVDAVARSIRSLLMEGYRFRDIGVLTRDLERYHGLIESSFDEHGISYFLDRRRAATHHPLLEFLRCVFQIALEDWPHDAVMSLLRSGLAGITPGESDVLENYVLAHRIHGPAGWEPQRAWDYRRVNLGSEDRTRTRATGEAARAESLRKKAVDPLQPLLMLLRSEQPRPAREFATEIFKTLDRLQVRATLAQFAKASADAGDLEQSAEHEQVWRNVADLFEQLVELLGDEALTAAEFHDVLETGLDSFDLALTPPTVDQVLVGQVDRTRIGALRAMFILGLNEGEFPRAAWDHSILNDRERRTLRSRRIELESGAGERMLDERLLGYIAFTRASQRLIVTRPKADERGWETAPSVFWRRIVEMFPNATRTTLAPPHAPSPAEIATPRQLVTSLMRWVRHSSEAEPAEDDATWRALYQWLSQREEGKDAIGLMRLRAWRALSYQNEAELSADIVRQLFQTPLHASVAQLESFAACPFQHFARHTLALRERDLQEVTVGDLGYLYHDLLEKAWRDVMRRRHEGDRKVRLEDSIERLFMDVGSALRGQIMLASARNRYLLDHVARNCRRIAFSQQEQLRRGKFQPTHAAISFGPEGNLPAFRVNSNRGEVLLQGKIDRVDRTAGGSVRAIDYRMSSDKFTISELVHGLSLKLVTHLLVLEANGDCISDRKLQAVAAFYAQLVRGIQPVKHPSDPKAKDPQTDSSWHLNPKLRGLFDGRCLTLLDKDLNIGRSEVVHAFIRRDGMHSEKSDALQSEDFRAVLNAVANKMSELADGILSGRISITPYRLNDHSPCSRCEYRPVCRFDPQINRYNHLAPIGRDEVDVDTDDQEEEPHDP